MAITPRLRECRKKEFIIERFDHGEVTGNKEDPSAVDIKQMRCLKNESNKRVFSASEYLTPQQIGSPFFSRLAAKKRANGGSLNRGDVEEINDDLIDPADIMEYMTPKASGTGAGSFSSYNIWNNYICRSVQDNKLGGFSIKTLADICS